MNLKAVSSKFKENKQLIGLVILLMAGISVYIAAVGNWKISRERKRFLGVVPTFDSHSDPMAVQEVGKNINEIEAQRKQYNKFFIIAGLLLIVGLLLTTKKKQVTA